MDTPLLNLRHLRAFCAVARAGGIARASPLVHMSQPAITQAIAKLEASLGAPLFARTGSGMVTTEAGALFLARAERTLAILEAGAAALFRAAGPRPEGGRPFHTLVTATQLRALLAIAAEENFTTAARSIGVAQPSLHRVARQLERLAGVPLYEKHAGGIALSEAADAFARHARLAAAELRQGRAEVDATRGIDTGAIVVGTLPLSRSTILPVAINRMAAARPAVRIEVVDGPYRELLRALRHGEVDLVTGALRDPPPAGDVSQEPLFHDALSIVARADHPLAGRKRVSLATLARHPFVVPRAGTPTRAHFERLFADAGLAPPAQLVEASSLVLIRELLRDSLRLTMISTHQVRDDLAEGRMRALPIDLSATMRPIGVTLRQGWRATPAQADFLDFLREAARDLGRAAAPPSTAGTRPVDPEGERC